MKPSGSKGSRSSAPSPVPTHVTGRWSSSCRATTMPPRAVLSNLASRIPVRPTTLAEGADLADGVLPDGRIEHDEGLVRSAVQATSDHALYLLEFLHQVAIGVEAAGSIHQHHVHAAGMGGGYRVMSDRRRVAHRPAHPRTRPRPVRPTPRAAQPHPHGRYLRPPQALTYPPAGAGGPTWRSSWSSPLRSHPRPATPWGPESASRSPPPRVDSRILPTSSSSASRSSFPPRS